MLNQFPLWKYLVVLMVLLWGIIYSLPNLYPPDYALQLSPGSATGVITREVEQTAIQALEQVEIPIRFTERDDRQLLIRLANAEDQLLARTIVQQQVGDGFVVALNRAENTP